jgi:excisionase family DNA binding protein
VSDQRYLTTGELADRLGCSTETVRRNCREGNWPYLKLDPRPGMEKSWFRFTPSHVEEIERYLETGQPATQPKAA